MFHICFIYFHLAFKQQQLFNNDINDNATTQQQLDYAVCMWYQSTLEQQTPKSQLEQITPQVNAGV